MNHLMSVTWAQSILIYLGALMQVVAIYALIKQKAGHRMLPRDGKQMRYIEHEEFRRDEALDEDSAHEYSGPTEKRPARWQPVTKTGRLTKTSKEPFKQTFKFR